MSTPQIQLTVIPGGYRVKDTGTHYIDVLLQLYNWRVVIYRHEDDGCTYEHGWCYKGTGPDTLVAAVLAAHAWDGAEGTSPEGCFKQAF